MSPSPDMQILHILIRTRPFFPSIGGLEAVMLMLAEEFTRRGHRVTVVTETPHSATDTFPFAVLRRPSLRQILRAQREADVVMFGNISLRWCLDLLLCPRPWIATHHGWYFDPDQPVRWRDRLKIALTALADANVSVSQAVNRFLGNPGVVIPNPYDHETFHLMPSVRRDRDLVFLGRLVSDKGVDILLEALALLRERGLRPQLTVIGGGPEREALQGQAERLGLTEQVSFVGPKRGQELAEMLNGYRVLVIPSRCYEGFGMVALEGIACGCVAVGSSGGGLPEAVGPCGEIFPNGDAEALAATLARLLSIPGTLDDYLSHAPAHLSRHRAIEVADGYLRICAAASQTYGARGCYHSA